MPATGYTLPQLSVELIRGDRIVLAYGARWTSPTDDPEDPRAGWVGEGGPIAEFLINDTQDHLDARRRARELCRAANAHRHLMTAVLIAADALRDAGKRQIEGELRALFVRIART